MRRRKLCTILLSLMVVSAMQGSAFAANAIGKSETSLNTPVVQESAIGGEVVQTPEEVVSENPTPQPLTSDVEAQEVVTAPAVELQPSTNEEQLPDEVVPEQGNVPENGGSEVTVPSVEPVVTEPEVVTEPAVVTDPAIATEPAVATEPAIVTGPATLTITQRLVVGELHMDDVQVIEGLQVGQQVNLKDYLVSADWLDCITQETNISLDQTENAVVLEYVAKPDSDVKISVEDGTIIIGGDADADTSAVQ